jgi:amphi-Trp domain-containing protein
MEYVELFGERHRALRRMKMEMPRKELADVIVKLGESMREASFNVSDALPTLESMEIELPEQLMFKFLYAPEGDEMEIEIEVEWPNKQKT